MTRIDLDRVIAEKVMGWKHCGPEEPVGPHRANGGYIAGGVPRSLDARCLGDSWFPSQLIEHAWHLEEKILKSPACESYIYYLILICTGCPEFGVTTMPANNVFQRHFTSGEWKEVVHASPLNRCLAALVAVGEIKLDDIPTTPRVIGL